MADEITITLPDGSSRQLPAGATVLDLATEIGPGLAKATVAGVVDGRLVDLRTPLPDGAEVRIITPKDPEGGEVIRHSAEHVLADAVQRLWPGTEIDAGRQDHSDKYQYDFRFPRSFTPDDLETIEAKMAEILKEKKPFERIEIGREKAREIFAERDAELKLDRLEDIPEGETISLYQHGSFLDLCRGPHVQHTGQIGAVHLLETGGAYYRGDESNEMLQRIYGTAFASAKELKAHLEHLEELKRRDHRRLGPKLGLFSFHPEAPASPFFLPRGAVVYNQLVELMREGNRRHGFDEVITPQVFDVSLWKRSGHYDNYQENMYFCGPFQDEDERLAASIKPMNCPSHCLIFSEGLKSYRDLPVRLADFGRLHRWERSGVVGGLTRVRTFCQDDAHVFCTTDQIGAEIENLFQLFFEVYGLFGFPEIEVFLSTRPEKAIGDPAVWEHAEKTLAACLEQRGQDYTVNPGDGAFYGPKIDFVVTDAVGREWQLATMQLDFNLPERFDLSYVDAAGEGTRPVMIHRAILGSIERFYGVMLEHFAGDLPPWLAPVQARLLPITDDQLSWAHEVAGSLRAAGVRVEVDTRSEKLGYKIREAETEKVPYLLVVGQREAEAGQVLLRLRHRRDEGVHSVDAVVDRITAADRSRSRDL